VKVLFSTFIIRRIIKENLSIVKELGKSVILGILWLRELQEHGNREISRG